MLAPVRRVVVVLLAVVASGCVSIADYEPDVRAVLGRSGDVIFLIPNDAELDDARAKGEDYFEVWNPCDPYLVEARRLRPDLAEREHFTDYGPPTIWFRSFDSGRLERCRQVSSDGSIDALVVDPAALARVGLDWEGEYVFYVVPRADFDEVVARGDGPPLFVDVFLAVMVDLRTWWFGIDDWTRSRTAEVIIDPALLPPVPIATQPPG